MTDKEILKFIPLDKSWIIRLGFLDLINGSDDIKRFLDKQDNLGSDLKALKDVAENWDNKYLNAGESGTLYRFLRFYFWNSGEEKVIEKQGTLKNRDICDNPEIVDYPVEELLKLDNGTSQWASASYLIGKTGKINNAPEKLKLSYETLEYWKKQRLRGKLWQMKKDNTIKKQALAYINYLITGKMNFEPEHSEDYCFARAFNIVSSEQGEKRWPQLKEHESDRIREMEEMLKKADLGDEIDSKDHRVIQAVVMKQVSESKDIKVRYNKAVNKSWPEFWDFISFCINK
jgi:hypothetical protein